MTKTILFRLIILVLFLSSCKKDSNPMATSQFNGLWEVDLLTITYYDSLGNISDMDTVEYVDDIGNTVTALEQFDSNNKFHLFSNSTNDTISSGTFNLNSNNLIINLPDSVFPFNNRTITLLTSHNLQLIQNYNTPPTSKKWTQSYHRL